LESYSAKEKVMVFGLFKKKEPVKVTIKSTGDEFMCEPGELLMKAALKAKIAWPLSCKVGSCGSCRATILEGEGKYPPSPADPIMLLYKEEIDSGMVIACQWTPTTDIVVDVEVGKEGDKRGMI
tara:strand:- start:19931 stop:20302 length:372 start_codon:yes stop_codon:yes gene_type:complete